MLSTAMRDTMTSASGCFPLFCFLIFAIKQVPLSVALILSIQLNWKCSRVEDNSNMALQFCPLHHPKKNLNY